MTFGGCFYKSQLHCGRDFIFHYFAVIINPVSKQSMAIKKIPAPRLDKLVKQHWSAEEWPDTHSLMIALAPAAQRGWLKLAELEKVCYWKSPRAIHYIRANSAAAVKKVTAKALACEDEQERIEILITLKGVSFPMASALLTLLNPEQYGVIDIRVWQLLQYFGLVEGNLRGTNFTTVQWLGFLSALRGIATRHKVKVRDAERTLFIIHTLYQEGLLYTKR